MSYVIREQTDGVEADSEGAALELFRQAMAYTYSAALRAAAQIGLADHMSSEPRALGEIADAVGCRADDLRRMLRLLVVKGVIDDAGADRYRLTQLGMALRSDAPHCARAGVRMLTDPMFWTTSEGLSKTLLAPSPTFADAFGSTTGGYFTQHPDKSALFYRGMEEVSEAENRVVAGACPLPTSGTVADIGGRFGSLLREVLLQHPTLDGILFDRAEEVAKHRLGEEGLSARVQTVGGDYYEGVPAADAYLLKRIVHNCSDGDAVKLLANCRRSAHDGAKVLIIEALIPSDGEPHDSKCMDFMMLATVSGGERTLDQLTPLVAEAGLRIERVVSTPTPMSIVVASEA
ncbi:MAG: methyltransferase [Pseudomonadota bacterium]